MSFKSFLTMSMAGAVLLTLSACIAGKPSVAVSRGTYSSIKPEEHQQLPSRITMLSLEDAQHIAAQNSPTFKKAYYAISSAKAVYYSSYSTYMPTITAGFTMTRSGTEPFNRSAGNPTRKTDFSPGMNLNWMVFDSFQRELNVVASKHKLMATEAQERDAHRILMRSVAYAYNDVLLSLAKIDIAIANMDFNRKMLDETTLKFEAGASTLSDVLNFKIQFNNAESSLNSAEHALEISKFALAYLMGLTEGNIPSSVSFPNMPSPDGIMLSDVNVYLDLALQNRPDLKKMRETLEANKYSFYSSIAAFGPTVSWDTTLNYSNSFNSEHSRYGNEAQDKVRKSVGSMSNALTVSWEIFSGGRTYFNMRATEANMKTVEYDLANTWMTVINEVRTAYDNYLTSLKQVKLYQKNLELVRKTRDLVEQEYNAGSTAITRLNEVQRDLVDSESALATAVINLHNAKAQLDTSVSAD